MPNHLPTNVRFTNGASIPAAHDSVIAGADSVAEDAMLSVCELDVTERGLVKTFKGVTPLHIAALVDNVRVLRNAIALRDSVTRAVASPDSSESAKVRAERLREAMHATVDGRSLVEFAARGNSSEVIRLLVASGFPVDSRNVGLGGTPLYVACYVGQPAAVRALLELGANKEAANNNGATPLYVAAMHGHLGIVRDLVDAGADASATNRAGSTPLYIASQNGHAPVVEYLCAQRGVDKNTRCVDGATALYIACENNHPDVIRALLVAGADAGVVDASAHTPLHIAAFQGHTDAVRLLAANSNVDFDAASKSGATPFYLACKAGHVDVARALIAAASPSKPVNVNHRHRSGETPFLAACAGGRVDVVRYLLSLAPRVDIDVKKPTDALTAAREHREVVALLLNARRPAAASAAPVIEPVPKEKTVCGCC